VIALLLACASGPALTPAQKHEGTTANGLYHLAWETKPAPIPMGQLFEIDTTLTDAKTGKPIEDAVVRVDARMPQHGHGMATKPEDVGGPHPSGVYVTRGMKFHMPGDWTITFTVDGPAGSDRLESLQRL
jgi:hypothetical protein